MHLTFAPRTRAVRARWILEEAGVPYALRAGPDAPVLEDDAVTLTESPTICLYLADRFGLAPAVSAASRATYLHWLLFAETVLDPLLVQLVTTGSTDASALSRALTRASSQLGDAEFAAGAAFSAADVCLASVLHLAYSRGQLEPFPRLSAYVHRHTARPAARRAVTP